MRMGVVMVSGPLMRCDISILSPVSVPHKNNHSAYVLQHFAFVVFASKNQCGHDASPKMRRLGIKQFVCPSASPFCTGAVCLVWDTGVLFFATGDLKTITPCRHHQKKMTWRYQKRSVFSLSEKEESHKVASGSILCVDVPSELFRYRLTCTQSPGWEWVAATAENHFGLFFWSETDSFYINSCT